MRSVNKREPVCVLNLVSKTFVLSTYRRSVLNGAVGAIRQWPAWGSSRAPNIDGLSKRGQQSQSIDPSREISAAERQSPMIA